jgi:hypothetical protein
LLIQTTVFSRREPAEPFGLIALGNLTPHDLDAEALTLNATRSSDRHISGAFAT